MNCCSIFAWMKQAAGLMLCELETKIVWVVASRAGWRKALCALLAPRHHPLHKENTHTSSTLNTTTEKRGDNSGKQGCRFVGIVQ